MAWAILLAALAACAPAYHFVPAQTPGFVRSDAGGYRHWVYRPSGWSAERRWPVIVYLHGGGELGVDGDAPTQVGLGPVVARSAGAFPFVVVFPQATAFWPMPAMAARVLAAADEAVRDHAGDPSRIYLTGNSMGGYGTWLVPATHPGRFAALVPIAGGVRPPFGGKVPPESPFAGARDLEAAVAAALRRIPVWVFHGDEDWMVSPDFSRWMVRAMRAAGGEVRYTEYRGVGHQSENRAYGEPELYRWLLAHSLPAPK
jgi:predicted peptidase